MTVDTPYHWLVRVAEDDPERPCLFDEVDSLTYGEMHKRVDERAESIATRLDAWDIVPLEVNLDIDSIVEILAIQRAGGVPLPHTGRRPQLPLGSAVDIALCVETSGSSGTRRIVPLTYSNVEASVSASRKRLGNTADDRWLICMPLDHVGGLSILWRTLEAGGSAVVAPFDPSGVVIERSNPTLASLVPTMVHRLADDNPGALTSIGSVLVGGAGLAPSLWDRCRRGGANLVPTYGLTEAGSQVATAPQGQVSVVAGWVGPPLDGMDVVIVGPDHEPVPVGQSGLISIEGSAVFGGYLGGEFRHGRFITNDIGRFDREGDLHVEGRIDDVIVSGGENVSLGWVASVLLGLGGIDDACVVGVEDAEWGTIGCAMVVSDVELESLGTMVEDALKPHERPKRWLVRSEIPKLANGKHDLATVREAFEEESWI